MSPIDLPNVRARAAAIAAQFSDPPAALKGARALLEDYADPSHRASQVLTDSAPTNTFKTPMPVVRAVITALRKPLLAEPLSALPVLQGLWAAGSREERRIAAELLGMAAPRVPAEALALLEGWLPEIEGSETADALAEHALGPLMVADPATHLRNAQRWVLSPHKWTRRFALAALRPLAKDRQWDGVPEALSVVRPAMDDAEAEVRKAAAAVLSDLLPKGPVEVQRFLREQAARVNHNTHWIVRTVLPRLSPQEQAEIVKVMRA